MELFTELVFIIYINDLPENCEEFARIYLSADDAKLFKHMWGLGFRGIGGDDVVIDALVVTSWVMATSGIYWLAMSVMCLVAPEV